MTPIVITLALLVLAIILFASEKLPVDVVGLLLVITLVLTQVLTVQEAVAGFGNDIIITIGGLFVLVGGLVKTGIVDEIGHRIHRLAGSNEFLLTALIMFVAALSASMLKNTTTTAMFLPVVMGIAAKAKIAPSKLLMPLAFGAILGGSLTLIGTSTNLAVSGAIQRYGQQPFSMFELLPVGIVTFSFGMLYMLFFGRHMLPRIESSDSLTDQYKIRDYVTELVVLPRSPLVGRKISETDLSSELGLTILGIVRDGTRIDAPRSSERIRRRDSLIVEGKIQDLLRVKPIEGIEIKPDLYLDDEELSSEDVGLYEAIIMRDSVFVGQTLKTIDFRQRYRMTVLAINRHGTTLIEKLSDVKLKFGDVLLIQGRKENMQQLASDDQVVLVEEISETSARFSKRKWAVAAFLLFLGLSISKVVTGLDIPLAVAVLLGVMVLLATQTVRYRELYSLIDMRLLVMIACMMSFGAAMESSGADRLLAGLIQTYIGEYGSTAVIAGFFILTVALTQPMSNQAAALVVLPVAVKTALTLGLNPRTFIIAITYAASFSFITPLEPACVLIYTPGRYRFMDFVKIGSILTIVVFIVSIVLVPIFWPVN
ncbi:MAG: potassium transporter peripheral membrane component [Acidobacteria bacterium OLB17]|nr:MAG: potassium transporter peripheral membrane component [Acidobacteria bacterium OLB17]MCZ2390808.1 SLC13 family permease [Acidobacteriota bacterium]